LERWILLDQIEADSNSQRTIANHPRGYSAVVSTAAYRQFVSVAVGQP
jgi:hypothetical protein